MAKKALTETEQRILRQIGRKIKGARQARKWNLKKLVEKIEQQGSSLTERRLQYIEAGEHNVSALVLFSIFRALRFDRKELEGPRGNPADIDLHEKLQEVLDGPGNWPEKATDQIRGLYMTYEADMKNREARRGNKAAGT